MSDHFQLILDSSLDEIDVLAERVEIFATSQAISPDTLGAVLLALEEVISNVIKYGYKGEAGQSIVVEIKRENDLLMIKVEDSSPPFNPLSIADPNLAKPMSEREPGGLGIHLIKHLMTRIEYEYSQGKNRLTLWKSV